MARYQIWDKTSRVITPVGEVLTPEQWIKRYPMAGLDEIKFVIAGGTINGAFAGELTSMMDMYTRHGCVFAEGMTDEEILATIEAFEDAQAVADASAISAEERIAAALEYQVMASLPDAEV